MHRLGKVGIGHGTSKQAARIEPSWRRAVVKCGGEDAERVHGGGRVAVLGELGLAVGCYVQLCQLHSSAPCSPARGFMCVSLGVHGDSSSSSSSTLGPWLGLAPAFAPTLGFGCRMRPESVFVWCLEPVERSS